MSLITISISSLCTELVTALPISHFEDTLLDLMADSIICTKKMSIQAKIVSRILPSTVSITKSISLENPPAKF